MNLFSRVLSAYELAEGLQTIVTGPLSTRAVRLNLTTSISSLSVSFSGTGSAFANHAQLAQFLSETKSRPYVICSNATVSVPGQANAILFNLKFQSTEPAQFIFDGITDPTLALVVADALHAQFNVGTRGAVLGGLLPKAEQEIIRHRESVVGDLEAAVARIGTFLQDQIERNSKFIEVATTKLQEQQQQKEAALEARNNEIRNELMAERKKFEEERRLFDDRERTHVRRGLLDKLNGIIANRKSNAPISKRTEDHRRWIHLLCAGSITISAMLFVWGLLRIAATPGISWQSYLPMLSATALFVSTLIYYLRWNDQWFKELARFEFATKKLEADITRASWVAELYFEYKDERGVGLPTELLSSLTRDLFVAGEGRDAPLHPADDILRLLNGVQDIRVNRDGLEISRKPAAK